jgi:alginate O-acetyltransferase complex protein AlgI
MLFNSHVFLFLFLPITLLVVLGLARVGARQAAKAALFLSSLFFYGYWDPRYVALLLGILAVNYATAQALLRLVAREGSEPSRARTATLALGLSLNIGVLVYFKYTNFVVATLNGVLSHKLYAATIVLPLGISFITFQKIALLVDVYSGTVASLPLLDYCLFVTFFPQLIAGPIVHHRELIPQLSRPESLRPDATTAAAGVTLFVIGLAKKVLVADALAPKAALVYTAAAAGSRIDLTSAWSGGIHYMFQLYYDFSGYSDMAIGLGMLFGVHLPFNFNSPYKAVGFVDYWQRWHITLTHFLTAYVYNPVVLCLTRRRLAAGKKTSVKGRMRTSAFVTLLAIPTLYTMGISGLWHGAGFQFIVFGLLHGVYLVIDHAYLTYRKKEKGKPLPASPAAVAAARVITLLGVLIGSVFFRADSVRAALRVLKGMTGLAGIGAFSLHRDPMALLTVTAAILATQLLPNAQEILGRYLGRPGREAEERATAATTASAGKTGAGLLRPRALAFRPTKLAGAVVAIVAFAAIVQISDSSVFLYFNF